MSRPLKMDEDKRENRFTIYLTDQEQIALKKFADTLGMTQTNFIMDAFYYCMELVVLYEDFTIQDKEMNDTLRKVALQLVQKRYPFKYRGY